MDARRIRLINFGDDEALDEVFHRVGIEDYKVFLPNHLAEVLRKQHPNVELRSVELLGTPKCDVGGMPTLSNADIVIVDTIKIRLELRTHLSATGDDLHELNVALVINVADVQATPQITSDMVIRSHREIQ